MNDERWGLQSLVNKWRADSDKAKTLSDGLVGAPAGYFDGKSLALAGCANELQNWLDNVLPQIVKYVGEKHNDER